ncbi:MAG: phosphotransferase [Pseudomonadota bacterium]
MKEKIPGIKLAPELINFDEADAEWIVEEYVELALFQHSKIRKLVRDVLPELYGNTCYQGRFGIEELPSLQSTKNGKISELIETFTRENYSLPYAYCHGDMTKSNILKDTQGNVLISDWENSGYRPVSTDLSRLYLHHKDVRDEIVSLLDSCSGQDRKSVPSRLQIAIALEAFLNKVAENTGNKLNKKQRATDHRGRALIEELLAYESELLAG